MFNHSVLDFGTGTDSMDEHYHPRETTMEFSAMTTHAVCPLDFSDLTMDFDRAMMYSNDFNLDQKLPITSKHQVVANNQLTKGFNVHHNPETNFMGFNADIGINSALDSGYEPLHVFDSLSDPFDCQWFESIEAHGIVSSQVSYLDKTLVNFTDSEAPQSVLDLPISHDTSKDFFQSSVDEADVYFNNAAFISCQNCFSSCTESSTPSSSLSTSKIRRKEIPEAEWQRIRPCLHRLYFREGRPLLAVMQVLADEYDFQASEQLFKKRIKRWEMTRSLRAAQKLRIINDLRSSATSSTALMGISQDDARKTLRFAQAEHRAGRLKALEYQTIQFKLERSLSSSRLQEAYSHAIRYFCDELQLIKPRNCEEPGGAGTASTTKDTVSALKSHSIGKQLDDSLIDGLPNFVESILDAAMMNSQPFSFSQLQSIETIIDDVRMFGRMNAFATGMKLMKYFLARQKYAGGGVMKWILAFMPYLCADMWISVELPNAFVSFISRIVEVTMGHSHPATRLFNHLQQKLPDIQSHLKLWTTLTKRCAERHQDGLDLWLTLALHAIKASRRATRFGMCANGCQKVIDRLSSVNKLTNEQRAVLLFEQARALSASGHTSRAEALLQATLQLAAENDMHRLEIKADLRLAELYSRDSSDVSLEQKHCTCAFRKSLHAFGVDSALTMLSLCKVIDFCKRQHKQIATIVSIDEYRAAFNHYVSINDLIKDDEKIEEITEQEF